MPFIKLKLRDFNGLNEKGPEYSTIINTKTIVNINNTEPPTLYWIKEKGSNSTTLSYVIDVSFEGLENLLNVKSIDPNF